jgi:hypothetical protein
VLRLDDERDVSSETCSECDAVFTLVKGFVFRDEIPYAVYFAACHVPDGERSLGLRPVRTPA